MEKPIILGGHFGNGIDIFPSGFNYNLQYGHIRNGAIKNPDFQISDIGREDMVKLATLLLILVAED